MNDRRGLVQPHPEFTQSDPEAALEWFLDQNEDEQWIAEKGGENEPQK